MKLEQTTGSLREFAERLFAFIEELTGNRPHLRDSPWYRVETARGRAFLFLRLIGHRAKRNPPNSIHLAARWEEQLKGPRVHEGTNWFESHRSVDLVVRADQPEELDMALEFVRLAHQIRNPNQCQIS
jgi:hypothetical protein